VTKSRSAAPRPAQPPVFDEEALQPSDEPLDGDLDVYQARIGGDHTGLLGGGEIVQSLVDAANLAGSRLDPLSLTDVRVRRGDVANAVWEGVTARRVEFDGCRAVGWRIIVDFAEELLVQGCRWDHGGIFLGRTRGAVVFRECSFAGTTLRGDFSRVLFDRCELAGAEFGVSAAAECDLRSSRLAGARGLLTLKGARITPNQALEIADLLAVEAGFRLE
jgi:uncharacterized protein YjbI with pentapeptide repeats